MDTAMTIILTITWFVIWGTVAAAFTLLCYWVKKGRDVWKEQDMLEAESERWLKDFYQRTGTDK